MFAPLIKLGSNQSDFGCWQQNQVVKQPISLRMLAPKLSKEAAIVILLLTLNFDWEASNLNLDVDGEVRLGSNLFDCGCWH